MAWKSYKDLIVWQKAMDLTDEIYRLTNKLPKEELFGLSNQLRRAAVSVPSNIAEGHGRNTSKEFCRFLAISNGTCMELETQLLICVRLKFLTQQDIEIAVSMLSEISRMLTTLILKTEN